MTRYKILRAITLIIFTAVFLSAGSAFADKPSWAGGGKSQKQRQKEPRYEQNQQRNYYGNRSDNDGYRQNFNGGRYFADRHRSYIHNYYTNEYRTGRCPPGLAKKRNGCMPPGQAKKWGIGRPLPRDVVYYDLPPTLAVGIGLPPPGYRFVRVASDILMIAIGTGLVMDAIQNLGVR